MVALPMRARSRPGLDCDPTFRSLSLWLKPEIEPGIGRSRKFRLPNNFECQLRSLPAVHQFVAYRLEGCNQFRPVVEDAGRPQVVIVLNGRLGRSSNQGAAVDKEMYWLFRKLGDHVINRGIEKMKRAGDKQQIRSGCVLPVACKLKLLFAVFLRKAPTFV